LSISSRFLLYPWEPTFRYSPAVIYDTGNRINNSINILLKKLLILLPAEIYMLPGM